MDNSIVAKSGFKYNRPNGEALLRKRILLSVCGVFIGAVNGLFGAGGGMLVVPVLSFVAKLDERRAHATAIAVMLPLCIVSSAVYALKGSYDTSVFLPTVGGVLLGGIIGALLLKKINNNLLSFVFYGLMLFAGLKMII